MTDIGCRITRVGAGVYIYLPEVGALAREADWGARWTLTIGGRVAFDLTPPADAAGEPIVCRVPYAAMAEDLDLGEAALQIGAQRRALAVALDVFKDGDRIEGHIATVTGRGVLTGWVTDKNDRQRGVPVNVTVGAASLFAFADKPWYTTPLRRFEIPLAEAVEKAGEPVRVDVNAGVAGVAFRRSPLFVMRPAHEQPGWIVMAPARLVQGRLEGVAQLHKHRDDAATMQLLLESGRVLAARCAEPPYGGYNFTDAASGFAFTLSAKDDLTNARLTIVHSKLMPPITFPLKSILVEQAGPK